MSLQPIIRKNGNLRIDGVSIPDRDLMSLQPNPGQLEEQGYSLFQSLIGI